MVSLERIIDNPILSKLELITKDANLKNNVTNVGIVDYEFDCDYHEEVVYYKGDLLLTSLYVAKDNPKLLYEIVKTLIDFEVSGLAIKNIYYQEIPADVLSLANKHRFPLFIFNNDLNFEDIIFEVLFELKKIEKTNYYEQLIDNIIKGFVSSNKGFALLGLKPYEYYIFIIKTKNHFSISTLRNYGLDVHVYPYHNSHVVFAHKNKEVSYYLDFFDDKLIEDYHIGFSELQSNFQGALNNSINNLKAAIFNNTTHVKVNSDYLSILLNNFQDLSYQSFMESFLKDIKHDIDLLDTLVAYHQTGGDIKSAAHKLEIHVNTLRYRLNKAKNIISKDYSELEFYKNLSLALTIYRLNNIDFVI